MDHRRCLSLAYLSRITYRFSDTVTIKVIRFKCKIDRQKQSACYFVTACFAKQDMMCMLKCATKGNANHFITSVIAFSLTHGRALPNPGRTSNSIPQKFPRLIIVNLKQLLQNKHGYFLGGIKVELQLTLCKLACSAAHVGPCDWTVSQWVLADRADWWLTEISGVKHDRLNSQQQPQEREWATRCQTGESGGGGGGGGQARRVSGSCHIPLLTTPAAPVGFYFILLFFWCVRSGQVSPLTFDSNGQFPALL